MAATTEDSPFQSCMDDSPLPPLLEDDAAATEGVASMIDSPFASSLITPGLMEQLSQSVAASSSKAGDGSEARPLDSNPQQQSRADAPAGAMSDTAAGAKPSSGPPRLQGVASILESPFASTCLSQEAQHLQQLNLNGADKAAAA